MGFVVSWSPLFACRPCKTLTRWSGRGNTEGDTKKTTKKPVRRRTSLFFYCFLHPHHVFFSKPCPPIIQPQTQRSRASHTCSVLFSCVGVVVVSVDVSFFRLLSCSFIHSFSPFFRVAYRRNMRPNHHYCPSYEYHYFHY